MVDAAPQARRQGAASTRALRAWCALHRWSSLVCTLFLLLLCLTGLPLVFYHELEALGADGRAPAELPADIPPASLDRVVSAALAERPGEFVQYVIWDSEEPQAVYLSLAEAPAAPPDDNQVVMVDGRTAEVLRNYDPTAGVLFFLYRLHVDLFAGLSGKLFLGAMGLLLVVSVVSGVVVYGPFMRQLDFGTVRRNGSPRLRWLDLHNLLGIVTLSWVLVVGATGVVNTLADVIETAWQRDQLATMTAAYAGRPPPSRHGSLEAAVAAVRAAAPAMTPSFIAFPQSGLSSAHHYAVFMRGETPFTSRLLRPYLVDTQTGELTASAELPWYVTLLLLSQPLHFGDYGGLPLKIVWALLDVVTIAVLGSGLYLWLARGSSIGRQRA